MIVSIAQCRKQMAFCAVGIAAFFGVALLATRADEIHDAVVAHDILRVRQLILEHPEMANARNEKGDTPLYIAAF
ncbi:MAG: hypothetical protein EB141_11075, partial [Verrucomicrobia bacterium]|nr:hypothetical protein [Verrucomicrobiota bacterium]